METGEQLRAARALLKMEQSELSRLAAVSVETIKRLERIKGTMNAQMATITALRDVLVGQGIVFTPGNGVLPGVAVRRDPPAIIRERIKRGSKPSEVIDNESDS